MRVYWSGSQGFWVQKTSFCLLLWSQASHSVPCPSLSPIGRVSLGNVSKAPRTVPGLWKWLPKAALNELMNLSPVPPSQLKSNVISLDCHISQYATICQQLQAEVRSPPGELDRDTGCPARGQESQTRAVGRSQVSAPTLHLLLTWGSEGLCCFDGRWPP